jgi:hypothetical protein
LLCQTSSGNLYLLEGPRHPNPPVDVEPFGYAPDIVAQFADGFPTNWRELVKQSGLNMDADEALHARLQGMTCVQLRKELAQRNRRDTARSNKAELVARLKLAIQKEEGRRARTAEDELLDMSPEQLHDQLEARGLTSQVLLSPRGGGRWSWWRTAQRRLKWWWRPNN